MKDEIPQMFVILQKYMITLANSYDGNTAQLIPDVEFQTMMLHISEILTEMNCQQCSMPNTSLWRARAALTVIKI